MKILERGAEAIIKENNSLILKDRVRKSYRFPQLDERIRKSRTKREASLIEKAGKLILTPGIKKTDLKEKVIEMDFISGKKLSDNLDSMENAEEICLEIGRNIAKLHDAGIIHGDLTTSNMIYNERGLFFIDFGLGFSSDKAEDRAVDLHLIKEALEARHFENFDKFFSAVLEGYKISKHWKSTIERVKRVEARGRYKKSY